MAEERGGVDTDLGQGGSLDAGTGIGPSGGSSSEPGQEEMGGPGAADEG